MSLKRLILGIMLACALGGVASEAEIERLEQRNQAILPGTPAHSEGMLLFLNEEARKLSGDEKKKAEFEQTLARWKELHAALAEKRNPLDAQTGRFEWAFRSRMDGSGQPIMLEVPAEWDRKTPLPLVIGLHGLGGTHRSWLPDKAATMHLKLYVLGRGNPFYRASGERDVLEALEFVRAMYPVDPDRIGIGGMSMGGWGVNRMAARYPGLWSGVVSYCGWAYGLPVKNFVDLPVQFHHGDADWAVGIGNQRLIEQDFAGASNGHFYEYPGVGHNVLPASGAHSPIDFLLRQKRNPFPEHLFFETDLTFPGFREGLSIERLLDPHCYGSVKLERRAGQISGTTKNIERLTLSAPWPIQTVALDNQELTVPAGRTGVTLARRDGVWHLGASGGTEYSCGGMFSLFDGAPIRFVVSDSYGQNAAVGAWSRSADLRSGDRRRMPYGQFPVRLASEIGAAAPDAHLILVGGPEDNPAVAAFLPHWPVRFEEDSLVIRHIGRFPKKTTALALVFRHPENPRFRTLWLYNQTEKSFPAWGAIGGWAWRDRLPDLMAHDVSGADSVLLAAGNFGNDWIWAERGAEPILQEQYRSANGLQEALMLAAWKKAGTDGMLYGSYNEPWAMQNSMGSLGRSSLLALLPVRFQPLTRAVLNRGELQKLREFCIAKPEFRLRLSPNAEEKEDVSLLLPENIVMMASYGKYNFPKEALSRTGLDLRDFIGAVLR